MQQSEVPSSGTGLLFRIRKHPWAVPLFVLLFLGGLLHRPLLRSALSQGLRIAAARQGLVYTAHISGNMLTRCLLEHVQVKPLQSGSAPVEWLQVKRAEFRYNPLHLLWHGKDHGLSQVEIEGVDVGLPSPREDPKRKTSFPDTPRRWNRALLGLPIFWTESISLSAVNIVTAGNSNGFRLQGGSLSARPGATGVLEIESLQITGDRTTSISTKASTFYDDRKFELQDITISPSIQLTHLKLDASARNRDIAKVEIEGLCGDGNFTAHLQMAPREWILRVDATQITANSLRETVGQVVDHLPDLTSARIDAAGHPQRPRSWKGLVHLAGQRALRDGSRGMLECDATLSNGTLNLTSLAGASATSRINASGQIFLPATLESFSELKADAEMQFESSHLEEWRSTQNTARFGGALKGAARLKLLREGVQAEIHMNGASLQMGALRAARFQLEGSFSAPVRKLQSMEHVAGNAVISVSGPAVSTETFSAGLEEGACALSLEAGTARFWNLLLKDTANTLSGEISVPLIQAAPPPTGSLHLDGTNLSQAGILIRHHAIGGTLQATWTGSQNNGSMSGQCSLSGKSLSWGDFQVTGIRAEAFLENQKVTLKDATLEWSGSESIRASGFLTLQAEREYGLKAKVHLPNVERISPLLAQLGASKNGISGSLEAGWEGTGSLVEKSGTGQWHLRAKNARWENVKLEVLECEGRHQPGLLVIEPLRFATKSTKFGARIHWTPGALQCSQVALEQWGHPSLSGDLELPIAYDKEGLHWVKDAKISGHLKGDKLDLATMLTINGVPSPLKGSLQLELGLAGDPSDPTATLRCTATGLRPAQTPQFGVSTVVLDARYAQGTLSATANLTTPFQAPIRLTSSLSLPLADLFAGNIPIQELPLEASIQATNLNLTALPGLLSEVRKVNGQAAIDLKLRGTTANPTWQGSVKADCPLLHFSSDRIPAVGGLSLAADVSDKEFRLTRLKADLGGGNLEVSGNATFATPGDPILAFKAKAHEVLVVRNSKLALRLNGDLFLKGPFKHAEISGSVSPTKSRLQKDIEVLPLNVLRMEIPKETRTAGKPWLVFRKAPFSDWRFNVEIQTAAGDPLLLRGNRLRGTLDAEMHLEGTGATPTIHGAYRSTDLTATLPFARIELSRGQIWYTRDHPFQPHVDFSAETEVRNHRIRLYLSGPANAPHISANSEPPEPESDLLTLIATGTLPGDVNEKSQVLASRAAAVLFQEFSEKLLPSGDRERFSALRRFSLDLGAVNNRSGQQETRLTYRMLDDLFMIGELRTGGDFAARVRYLLRFR